MSSLNNPALERDALYAKSQVYIKRGMRAQADGDLEEYQLWASLALELLGKASLAQVHPALVADPTHFQSLFAACGRHLSPDIKTITAKTLFERLSHLEKSFDTRYQKFCEQMVLRRNAELHSGESPFSGMSADAWEREFWGAVETVLSMQNETLETWLGVEDAKAPAQILKQATTALQWAVENRINRCKQDFEKKYQDPQKRASIIEDSKKLTKIDFFAWDKWIRNECPACAAKGFLGGILWNEEIIDTNSEVYGYDEYGDAVGEVLKETVEKTYTSEIFECLVCSLKLYGVKEIAVTDLPEEFSETVERDREYEPDYGNE